MTSPVTPEEPAWPMQVRPQLQSCTECRAPLLIAKGEPREPYVVHGRAITPHTDECSFYRELMKVWDG